MFYVIIYYIWIDLSCLKPMNVQYMLLIHNNHNLEMIRKVIWDI